MNKYGNHKSKENDSRNNGSSPPSHKAASSPDNARDTGDANQKTGQANPTRGEADSQQQKQTSTQPAQSNQATAADDDKQPQSSVIPSEARAPGTSTSTEEDTDDEADELEAEKAGRHEEPSSQEQKSDAGRHP